MFKRFTPWLEEDAPANAAGLGGVAALGVGPKGEPGVDLRNKKKKKRIAQMANDPRMRAEAKSETCKCSHPRQSHEGMAGECAYCECLEYVPWGTVDEAVEPQDTFAGAAVFEVDMDKIMSARMGKNRYHRYSRYVGTDEVGESIRQHGRKHGGDIILKDQKSAVMTYLRRKKPIGESSEWGPATLNITDWGTDRALAAVAKELDDLFVYRPEGHSNEWHVDVPKNMRVASAEEKIRAVIHDIDGD
jgi:hypothetical protein